jgi:hypothetical protein
MQTESQNPTKEKQENAVNKVHCRLRTRSGHRHPAHESRSPRTFIGLLYSQLEL